MNKEQARLQEIVRALHEPEVFCEGCGHHGEPSGCNLNGVGCKAWDYAQEAADIIESLQRERDNPQPLTWNQISERVGKPVYVRALERWEIIDHVWSEATHIIMRSGNRFLYGATRLYATEPKGDDCERL